MIAELRQFRRRRLTPEEGRRAAAQAIEIPIADRAGRGSELRLDDPETLLPLLETLRSRWEAAPIEVLEEASFLYNYLEGIEVSYPIGAFLLDEREYFLGETARIAGTVCRVLSRREEARQWFDRGEGWFLLTENASGNLAKLSYQRLALRFEERDFAALQELLPQLIAGFEKLGMSEDALRGRILQAAIFKETDNLEEAIVRLERAVNDARSLRSDPLLAHAYVNLVQIYGFLGNVEQASSKAKEATSILRSLGSHAPLAKLQWGIAALFRARSDIGKAVQAYRAAQQEFAEIGMRADVAAVHLVIADLLLDNGQDKQAEWEVRQALPIIDEYKLVPEGFAALTLLRESVRRQKIDRQALRNLHGYFEELSA
jgi:tetratricopeptide (TPR) repeat protein